jgi:competence protein ComEA
VPEYRGVNDIIVPSSWRERLGGGRRRDAVALLAVVCAVTVAGVALWKGATAPRIAPPATSERALHDALPAATPAAAAPTPTPAGAVFVHVAGAVRRPGLYRLEASARVADAIAAAGGARPAGDLDALNLADTLSDGLKVDVPRRGESVALVAPSPGVAASPSVGVVDLNQADQAALEAIPDIGPVTAAAILEYRTQVGGFSSVDQLLEVSGIGPATLESMRPYVTVG